MAVFKAPCLFASHYLLWLFVAAFAVLPPDASGAKGTPTNRAKENSLALFRKQHRELHAGFAKQLEDLARGCAAKGLDIEAAEIRKLAAPLDTRVLGIDPLPTSIQLELPADLSADERVWRNHLRHFQREYGKELYMLSRRALNAGHVSLAYDLVREVALQDPDNKAARNLLGYERNGDEWVTAYAARQRDKKYAWTEKYGWLPKEHVARYQNGERFYKNKWVSAAKESELRRDFRNAWKVETDHYIIATNHSLEQGVEVAKQLEDFHRVFFQMFAGFFNSPDQLKKLFEGNGPRSKVVTEKFDVNYYRTRDEYNQRLQGKMAQGIDIGITTGLYLPDDHLAYFFFDPSDNPEAKTTLFHEATHQLFSESRPSRNPVGVKANFWIIEGIACYMESFRQDGEHTSLGDPSYIRFQNAQHRYVVDKYYVPLARFAAMGGEEFQHVSREELPKNYTQASGLTHFFLHYEDGIYREALIEHLSDIYSLTPRIRDNPRGLDKLTEVPYSELDRQYGKYIKQLDCGVNVEAADLR